MFSAMTQGSPVYILDKTSDLEYKIGEILGVSFPKISSYGNTVDLKVKVDGNVQEFNSIPSINSFISYDNGNIILSETKQGIQNEVENILQSSKKVLNSIDTYEQNVVKCESILKQLNPQFAIDKERDERLSSLETKFDGIESKLDKIFELIKK